MQDSAGELPNPSSTPSLVQLDQAKKNNKISQGVLASSKIAQEIQPQQSANAES